MRVVPATYYQCIHFTLEELVPKPVFDELGEKAWQLFDPRALYTLDCLREFFGSLQCNNYKWGGPHQYRGFRPSTCEVGAKYSQHRFGRAFDLISKKIDACDLRSKIIENNRLFPYIAAIEDKVSWLHFDTRNCSGNEILIFKP